MTGVVVALVRLVDGHVLDRDVARLDRERGRAIRREVERRRVLARAGDGDGLVDDDRVASRVERAGEHGDRVAVGRRRDGGGQRRVAGRADGGDRVLRLAVEELVAVRAERVGLGFDELLVIVGLHRADAEQRIAVVDDRRKLRRRRIDRQTELELLPFAERLTGVERGRHVERRRADDRLVAHDLFHDLRRRNRDLVQHVQLVRVVRARDVVVARQLRHGRVDDRRVGHLVRRAVLDLRYRDRRLRLGHLDRDLLRFVGGRTRASRRDEERTLGNLDRDIRRHAVVDRHRQRLALRERDRLGVVRRHRDRDGVARRRPDRLSDRGILQTGALDRATIRDYVGNRQGVRHQNLRAGIDGVRCHRRNPQPGVNRRFPARIGKTHCVERVRAFLIERKRRIAVVGKHHRATVRHRVHRRTKRRIECRRTRRRTNHRLVGTGVKCEKLLSDHINGIGDFATS